MGRPRLCYFFVNSDRDLLFFIFQNPTISKEDFALILGNTFKDALQDFLPGKH